MPVEETIARHAAGLGIDAVGFAPLGPTRTIDRYQAWIARGGAAGMGYLSRNMSLRADPRLLAPGARSIVVAAFQYPLGRCEEAARKRSAGPRTLPKAEDIGRFPVPGGTAASPSAVYSRLLNGDADDGFAAYARGRDYHSVIGKRLTELVRLVRGEAPLRVARVCVDTAPIVEREWAVRAGLGWIGRQGQLVNERLGCALLLGEILVDLDLTPSAPAPNRCGRCARCVRACPTGAIGPDGLLAAERCRSYLTIEHRGPIPPAMRPLMGDAIFGCDICTRVCPWNRFGAKGPPAATEEWRAPDAADCLAMSPKEFKTRFRDTAVFRTGLERLHRNAAVALGNRGDPAAARLLRRCRDATASPLIREHIEWALARCTHRSRHPSDPMT